ncbi:MAG: hypothetical protein JWN40_489 [Phycisphaerales bacterium]|nr:hypothetical protein [Phycisphaerales bacterium]
MILSVVLILFVGLVAYLHYMQGLLNGLISVVLALIATAVAIAEYEPMATAVSGGKYNDQAQGVCLIALFALTYLIGRLIFDKLVPGNVRLPHLVDGIGGAVCGLIAGLMGTGIIAIGLQTMPFGLSIAGYARYPLAAERTAVVPGGDANSRQLDRQVIDEMKNMDFEKEQQGLLLPVDDTVVWFAKHLSNGGSLATDRPFESVHPDLIQELFAQRAGIEPGAKHTAMANDKVSQVEVVQVNVVGKLKRTVGEFESIWKDQPKGDLAADAGHRLITVTVTFKTDASDEDHIVRLGPGAVRVVTRTADGGWKNNFAIGTVQGGRAWMNRPDDFMFIDVSKEDRGANFLFEVDAGAVVEKSGSTPAPKAGAAAVTAGMAPETFIEVKRLAKISLEDVKVVVGPPPENPKYYPMRKAQFYKEPAKTPDQPTETARTETPTPTVIPQSIPDRGVERTTTPTPMPTPTPTAGGDNGWAEAPLEKPTVVAGAALPVAVNVGTADADAEVVTTAASGHITGKKFDILDVDTSSDAAAISELPKGGFAISELMAPAGKRLLQVKMDVKAGADPWAWAAAVGNFAVLDGAGAIVKPSGVVATVTKAGGPPKLLATYKAAGEVTSVPKVDGATATDIRFIYLLAADQKAKELQYQGKAGGVPLEK